MMSGNDGWPFDHVDTNMGDLVQRERPKIRVK